VASELHLYLAVAPRAGKTFLMLDAAHRMKHEQGADIVIGLIETHGRKETAERIRDLEVIPEKITSTPGVREPDIDRILARRPQMVVVDELVYAVPGGKNRNRCEAILRLLHADIGVITAVNVEHLETLGDARRHTPACEIVPDSFVQRVTRTVYIDISTAALRRRLREEF